MSDDTATVAEALGAYVARSAADPLSAAERVAVKRVLLHNVIVALAANEQVLPGLPSADRLLPWAAEPTTAPDLAFAISLRMGARAQHDEHPRSVSHLGSAVTPAVLAAARADSDDGRLLLRALVTGYQVGGVVGAALLPALRERGLRATGVVGPIAAAAGAAVVLGLDERRAANAIALAVNRAAGFTEVWNVGSDEWRMQTASAARDGLEAALWARGGATGAATVFEGRSGLLRSLGASGDLLRRDALGPALAGDPVVGQMLLKAHPVCAINQTAVELAVQLRGSLGTDVTSGIARVVVELTAADAGYPGIDLPQPPDTWAQAMMDVRQGVAIALVDGRVAVDTLLPGSDAVLALRSRIDVTPTLPSAAGGHGAALKIELADGRTLHAEAEGVTVDAARSAAMAIELLPAAGVDPQLAAGLPDLVDVIDEADGLRRLLAALAPLRPWSLL